MKKTKIIALLIAAVMLLSMIPMTAGAADVRHPIVKDVVEFVDGQFVSGGSYFSLGNSLYDENGNKIFTLDNENEQIYTLSDKCMITVSSNVGTLEDLGSIEDLEIGFDLYGIDGDTVTFKHSYDNYPYVLSYEGYSHTAVVHIDVISLFAGVFGSEITEDDAYDLIYGYDIIDEYGSVIYSRNGKAVATPIGDGVFLESWMVAGEELTNVLTVTDDGVSSINIDSNYLLVNGTELGDVMVITEDYKCGVMNVAGDFLVMDEFDAVFVSDEYYIAHEIDEETYSVVKSLVYDRNGDCVWKHDGPVTYYNGKVAAVGTVDSLELEGETFEFNIMKLIDLSTGDVIVDAENIFCEGEYIFAEYSSNRPCGTSVYSTDGEYIGGRDAFAVCVDEGNSTVIFEDYDKEKTYRVNADMEIVEELSYNNSYLKSYDNVSVVTDFGTADDGDDHYEDDCIDYLTYKGVKISGDHYSLWDNFVTDGCEVYVFSDYDAETFESTYVAYIIAGGKSPFYDVQEDYWAREYIDECFDAGIMNGTGGGKFSPAAEVSRAQVVTTLWRLAGEPEPEGENKFVDVQNVLWYSTAVTWAAENGITTGVGGAYFAPDRTVTRGEVAAILYRYAEYAGDDMTAKADLSTFADAGELSDWNRDAFAWCAAEGIITGKTAGESSPVRLAPSDVLTRAEIAAVLCRYGI